MRKRLKNYLKYMSEINYENLSEKELSEIMDDLLIQIGFFQHERLIHLIVTVFFALFTIIAIVLSFVTLQTAAFILSAAFLVLLVPYIGHYYILENGVQKLYTYYDKIISVNKTK